MAWQVDFYRRPLIDEQGQPLWELLVCSDSLAYSAWCPQAQASADWLVAQLPQVAAQLPDRLQVFRPQSLGLLELAGQRLGIKVEATRRTPLLKAELQRRAADYAGPSQAYDPLALEQPPPQALPESLWGDRWRFGSLAAGAIVPIFQDRPIPCLEIPAELEPLNLGIASDLAVPGVIIDGGRHSLGLARWLQAANPAALNYIPTEVGRSGGLILAAGLVDRWILATFEDPEIARAAEVYEERQQTARGLHFLLVRPDESGMTYSGFWLLQAV
ncbi:MAG: DUF1092 family protein [Chloroflexaceae bacterium]|nr:DUF1092 family protein [Chloroflexaceae bacterium]